VLETRTQQASPGRTARAGAIAVEHLSKVFGTRQGGPGAEALRDVSLEIAPGEFVSLVGASGCGKSTLLKLVAGLIPPTGGRVLIDGDVVAAPRRSVGIMFQTPELFPWRNVLENTMLPVDVFRQDRRAHLGRARAILEMVGLAGFERAYPRELSGGMQQRVALSRTLMTDPAIMLMDEPFGALDEFTRERLNLELLRIWSEAQSTIVFVTHNIGEAVFLSDRVVVMGSHPGRVLATVPVALDRPRTIACLKEPVYLETVFATRELLGVAH
jgi:NitT/TauT family transport system ATP-binding protein